MGRVSDAGTPARVRSSLSTYSQENWAELSGLRTRSHSSSAPDSRTVDVAQAERSEPSAATSLPSLTEAKRNTGNFVASCSVCQTDQLMEVLDPCGHMMCSSCWAKCGVSKRC